MDRRRFLLTSLAGALAGPLAAGAQQPGKVYRIVGLWTNPSPQMEDVLWQGLRELGWVEGQNFIFERRYAEGRNERHAAHVAELLRLQPDLIIVVGTPAALAAKEATTTIPIVFVLVADPVGAGLVRSLARPGGNITGLAATGLELTTSVGSARARRARPPPPCSPRVRHPADYAAAPRPRRAPSLRGLVERHRRGGCGEWRARTSTSSSPGTPTAAGARASTSPACRTRS
jgi:hypothetical protein